MSTAIFPRLPGLKIDTTKTPMWSTSIQKSASGRELRAAFYSYPLWKFSVSYEVLRADSLQELQSVIGFFNARQGSYESFLFEDPEDNSVTDQALGNVVSGQTKYQLVRNLGGYVEPIFAPQAGIVVKSNGVTLTNNTNYRIDPDGVLTLLTTQTAGSALTWSGGFYYKVRFLHDSADFERFMHRLWAWRKIEFQSVKP